MPFDFPMPNTPTYGGLISPSMDFLQAGSSDGCTNNDQRVIIEPSLSDTYMSFSPSQDLFDTDYALDPLEAAGEHLSANNMNAGLVASHGAPYYERSATPVFIEPSYKGESTAIGNDVLPPNTQSLDKDQSSYFYPSEGVFQTGPWHFPTNTNAYHPNLSYDDPYDYQEPVYPENNVPTPKNSVADPGRYRTRRRSGSRTRERPTPLSQTIVPRCQPSFSSPSPADIDRRKSNFRAEKPKKDYEHDWVRINGSTEGKSTRTGKINSYNPKVDGGYTSNEHPIGVWTGLQTGKKFEYTTNGELRERVFTADQINDFLFSHAHNQGSSLTLWIQKTPADCARRYPTRGSDKCLFAECPFKLENRNILVGHMRVAIDEQWNSNGDKRDPFHVAGYTHLYCMERFSDLPEVARLLNVQADCRVLRNEPRGLWGASLGEGRMSDVATKFIEMCKDGRLGSGNSRYPFVRTATNPFGRPPHSEPLPYEQTLTYSLTDAKIRETNGSKRAMMEARGLKPTNILVHKGNIQQLMDSKQSIKSRKKSAEHKKLTKRVQRLRQDAEAQTVSNCTSSADSESEEEDTRPFLCQPNKRKAAGSARKRLQELSDDEMVVEESDEDSLFVPEERQSKRRRATLNMAVARMQSSYAPMMMLPSQGAPTAPNVGTDPAPVDPSLLSPEFDPALLFG